MKLRICDWRIGVDYMDAQYGTPADHARTVLRFMGERRTICIKDAEDVTGAFVPD